MQRGLDSMKKNILLPGAAIAAGAVGFALRKWELATAFEPDTGLAISGAPAAYVLAAWSALVVIALIFLCRGEKESLPYDQAFRAEGCSAYITASVLSGFLLLIGAGVEVMTYPVLIQTARAESGSGFSRLALVLPLLRILLCILGFLCVLLISANLYRGRGKGKEHLPLLGLCVLFCVWLISDYQSRAVDPVVLDYVYEIFAICASLLGLYEMATYSFQTGKPRRTIVLMLLGAYFSLVTLADRHSFADMTRYGFAILFLTAHAALLLGEHHAGEVPAETEAEPHA